MPGWHARTEPLRKAGNIKVLGIIQEQHPERCQLFMQWKEMDWPIAVDALNLLQVAAVPYTLLIDEAGVVLAINPKEEKFNAFLESDPVAFESTAATDARVAKQNVKRLASLAEESNTSRSWASLGQHLFLWGKDQDMRRSVDAYSKAVDLAPDDGWLHFRLGVAYRRLFDIDQNDMNLFRKAIFHWKAALDLDPNQYIWRRRIQQYGPRLDKPYSFYDWIHQARNDIVSRGEIPLSLSVEPGGAEFAYPASADSASVAEVVEPDPEGKITRDEGPGIRMDHTLVAATYDDKKAVRLHLKFYPDPLHAMHWNNEAEPLAVWIQAAKGWTLQSSLLTCPNPNQATDTGSRSVEFEMTQVDAQVVRKLSGYALYYICEDINGVCLYRRQDFSIELE